MYTYMHISTENDLLYYLFRASVCVYMCKFLLVQWSNDSQMAHIMDICDKALALFLCLFLDVFMLYACMRRSMHVYERMCTKQAFTLSCFLDACIIGGVCMHMKKYAYTFVCMHMEEYACVHVYERLRTK